jgi:hypothetical protein
MLCFYSKSPEFYISHSGHKFENKIMEFRKKYSKIKMPILMRKMKIKLGFEKIKVEYK